MNDHSLASFRAMQDRVSPAVKVSQFLRGTMIVMLLGGVMYAAALVAHHQQRVTATDAVPAYAQQ
jgi:hypothetical protein